MSDRDIKNWDQRLKNQVELDWNNYQRYRLDLDTARNDEFLAITGELIYIEKVSSESAAATIKLNRNTNEALELRRGTKIKTIFKELYITHDAQAGEWMDLLIGINFDFTQLSSGGDKAQVQPIVPLTHANANTNVTPAAQICTRALIKADVNNTQTAWIDFGTAAVQNACFPLDPGESITVSINNLDQINANFQVGGEYCFIAYEV